jgi:pimeloyl-ACP methyl ester carboxylesterase
VLEAGPTLDERYAVQKQALADMIAMRADDDDPPVNVAPLRDDQSGAVYLDGAESRLHARVSLSGSGVPVVCLHGAVKSSVQMAAYVDGLVGRRPVYNIDLPGHGASARPETESSCSVPAMADEIARVLSDSGVTEIDLVGEGLGGAVAARLSQLVKTNRVVVVNAVPYTAEEMADYLKRGLPDVTPHHDGSHLAKAWAFVRDDELFWPWYDYRGCAVRTNDANLSPDHLHQRACDLMIVGAAAPDFVAAEVALDWNAVLSSIRADRIALLADDQHPCRDRLSGLLRHCPPDTQISVTDRAGLTELFDVGDDHADV